MTKRPPTRWYHWLVAALMSVVLVTAAGYAYLGVLYVLRVCVNFLDPHA